MPISHHFARRGFRDAYTFTTNPLDNTPVIETYFGPPHGSTLAKPPVKWSRHELDLFWPLVAPFIGL